MEAPLLTVEDMADYLWTEGFDLPELDHTDPRSWTNWIKRTYRKVTQDVDQWEVVLRSAAYCDIKNIGYIRRTGMTQALKADQRTGANQ